MHLNQLPNIYAIKKQHIILLFSLFIFLNATINLISADQAHTVDYFYESGCLKCQQISPVIGEIATTYNANLTSYELTTSYEVASKYNVSTVPAVVVDRHILIDYYDYKGNTSIFKALMHDAIVNGKSPKVNINEKQDIQLSTYLVFITGVLSGFNPCILAVIAFLASMILTSTGRRKDIAKMIVGFCFGIFITYMIAGISILKTVQSLPFIKETLASIFVVILFLLGLWHLYDAYKLKKISQSTFYTPKFMLNLLKKITTGNVLLFSIICGALFSLIKAPCVGALYFSILDMLMSKTDLTKGLFYLGLYNLGVIFPILILGFLLLYGINPQSISKFHENNRIALRIFTGFLLILLAILLHLHII